MIDKRIATVEAAVADVKDGSTVMIGGFRRRRNAQRTD